MSAEKANTIVVGAGQAGVAMSEHLARANVPHIVFERGRIAERWRSARWDSLVANGPAWHDRFPNMEFDGDPDAFIGKEKVADYFVTYAEKFAGPIHCGIEVTRVRRLTGHPSFFIETSQGSFEADNVVAATGAFQRPLIPAIIPAKVELKQIHSSAYMNPGQLPEGAVLVVGAGSSGVQIADELSRAGRQVYLSVGPHQRPPRTYRGRDYCWWLGVLGKWDAQSRAPGTEHVTIAVSGARGGETIDFRRLAAQGITLVGLTKGYQNGLLTFASDLADNIAAGDQNYLSLLDEADAYTSRMGLDLPQEPEARKFTPSPGCVTDSILELEPRKVGSSAIIWATGYTSDYGWLQVDAFDEQGRPSHQRGISSEPGIYFLGLPFLSSRGSSFIWGVWHDAKFIADHIVTQRRYFAYHYSKQHTSEARPVAINPPALAKT